MALCQAGELRTSQPNSAHANTQHSWTFISLSLTCYGSRDVQYATLCAWVKHVTCAVFVACKQYTSSAVHQCVSREGFVCSPLTDGARPLHWRSLLAVCSALLNIDRLQSHNIGICVAKVSLSNFNACIVSPSPSPRPSTSYGAYIVDSYVFIMCC